MQTKLQFGNPSTFQEWSNFKGILKQVKTEEKPLLKNGNNSENLVIHLTQQLGGAGIIKGFNETGIITLPSFSETIAVKRAV
ncbi:MAG: hypothetical protein H0W61_15765 [Bacteroidetes bacterium]|nr:hypothetical protein [Bacteroidota bacterium]